MGKSHTSVIRSINIFERFPKEIIEACESGLLKQAHLQYFYGLPNQQAMRKLFKAIVKDNLKSAEARALANRLDERWLSGDRELLAELVGKDPALKEILGSELTIADLVKKSKCTQIIARKLSSVSAGSPGGRSWRDRSDSHGRGG